MVIYILPPKNEDYKLYEYLDSMKGEFFLKGIVFSEFLEMVDDKFGFETTEEMIALSDLPSGGAYTSVGTYDHSEIVTLVSNLSKLTKLDEKTLIISFGKHLVTRFQILFPKYFENIDDACAFLEQVNDYIHVEVQKLYEGAELPQISTQRTLDKGLILNYKSARGMGGLAQGMIESTIEIFGAKYECIREDLKSEDECQCIMFTLKKKHQLN